MMQTLTISIEDQASTDKLLAFIDSMKNEGIKIISKQENLAISKNTPNERTVQALQDTDYQTVTLDEFKGMCE